MNKKQEFKIKGASEEATQFLFEKCSDFCEQFANFEGVDVDLFIKLTKSCRWVLLGGRVPKEDIIEIVDHFGDDVALCTNDGCFLVSDTDGNLARYSDFYEDGSYERTDPIDRDMIKEWLSPSKKIFFVHTKELPRYVKIRTVKDEQHKDV